MFPLVSSYHDITTMPIIIAAVMISMVITIIDEKNDYEANIKHQCHLACHFVTTDSKSQWVQGIGVIEIISMFAGCGINDYNHLLQTCESWPCQQYWTVPFKTGNGQNPSVWRISKLAWPQKDVKKNHWNKMQAATILVPGCYPTKIQHGGLLRIQGIQRQQYLSIFMYI